jgi:hypothetical protein
MLSVVPKADFVTIPPKLAKPLIDTTDVAAALLSGGVAIFSHHSTEIIWCSDTTHVGIAIKISGIPDILRTFLAIINITTGGCKGRPECRCGHIGKCFRY